MIELVESYTSESSRFVGQLRINYANCIRHQQVDVFLNNAVCFLLNE